MLTRFVLHGALLAGLSGLTGCGGSPPADDGPPAPLPTAPAVTTTPADPTDDGSTPSRPSESPVGPPPDACRPLDSVPGAGLAGAKEGVGVPTAQGPFRSCEYRLTAESGATGSVFLDVSGQRIEQLYEVATEGAQLSELAAIGTRAGFSPATGKVYVLTSHAFFTLALPRSFDGLATPDGLRSAAEQLAIAVVARLGP